MGNQFPAEINEYNTVMILIHVGKKYSDRISKRVQNYKHDNNFILCNYSGNHLYIKKKILIFTTYHYYNLLMQ